jgi:hypothetical protein
VNMFNKVGNGPTSTNDDGARNHTDGPVIQKNAPAKK